MLPQIKKFTKKKAVSILINSFLSLYVNDVNIIKVIIINLNGNVNNTPKVGYRYATEYIVPKKAPIHFFFSLVCLFIRIEVQLIII